MTAFNLQPGTILNFRDRALVLPSSVIVISLLIMLGALLFGVFVPQPNVAGVAKTQSQIQDVNRQITLLKKQQQQASTTIDSHVWHGSQNYVSASVLANLTALAKQEGLAVGSFRPQRTTDLTGISDLPFTVQISGPYPGIRSMMTRLDSAGSRVVLRSTQIIAATNTTTDVTATLGLSAYLATDPLIDDSVVSTTSVTKRKSQLAPGATPKRGAGADGR